MAFPLTRALALAHHPLCGRFTGDLLKVGRHRLCLGCFTAYPLALAIVVIWWLVGLPGAWYHHLALGLVCGAFQFASLAGLTRTKRAKMVVKLLLGLGFGLVTVGVLGLPVALPLRLILLFELSWTASMLAYFRTRSIDRVCLGCVWKGDWQACPGMNPPYGWWEPPAQALKTRVAQDP